MSTATFMVNAGRADLVCRNPSPVSREYGGGRIA